MGESPIFGASQLDPAMQAAYARARETFKYLWRELTWEYRRIVPGLELSAVKASFNDPGNPEDAAEHMWLSDIQFDGEIVSASLLNQPRGLRSVSAGDRVELSLEAIEDWMYALRGRVYGGFTIQAMRMQMPPAERKAHDRAWGFEFGDPEVVELVPNWSAKPKKGFFRKAKPEPGDPNAEHPMSVNMAEKLSEEIGKNREAFLTSADPDGLTMLHSMALGGSADGVRVLLAAGADRALTTKRGFTALALAKRMDWPRCVALLEDA